MTTPPPNDPPPGPPPALPELDGHRLTDAVLDLLAHQGEAAVDRGPIYQALLDEPVLVALVGPGAPNGPTLQLEGQPTRLVETLPLGAPVVALHPSTTALEHAAVERALWPDGVPRAKRYAPGAIFPLLRGQPGAAVVLPEGQIALDAGDVAALADKLTPDADLASLRQLIASGRAAEAGRRLARRMLYVLGHPSGGMVTFQRELPVFLHLAPAIAFAVRMGEQTGQRPEHALVAAAELFKYAVRGRLGLMVDPGPGALKLRSIDLR